jgi:hypothetical protein
MGRTQNRQNLVALFLLTAASLLLFQFITREFSPSAEIEFSHTHQQGRFRILAFTETAISVPSATPPQRHPRAPHWTIDWKSFVTPLAVVLAAILGPYVVVRLSRRLERQSCAVVFLNAFDSFWNTSQAWTEALFFSRRDPAPDVTHHDAQVTHARFEALEAARKYLDENYTKLTVEGSNRLKQRAESLYALVPVIAEQANTGSGAVCPDWRTLTKDVQKVRDDFVRRSRSSLLKRHGARHRSLGSFKPSVGR